MAIIEGAEEVAGLSLIAVRPTGEVPFRVKVMKPVQERDGTWSCSVQMQGLYDPPLMPIVGEDSFQALALALGMLRVQLFSVASKGGLRNTDGSDFALEAYFPPLDAPPV